jgi:hypothetical protein
MALQAFGCDSASSCSDHDCYPTTARPMSRLISPHGYPKKACSTPAKLPAIPRLMSGAAFDLALLRNRILLENYFLPGDLERQIAAFVEHYITAATARASAISPRSTFTAGAAGP